MTLSSKKHLYSTDSSWKSLLNSLLSGKQLYWGQEENPPVVNKRWYSGYLKAASCESRNDRSSISTSFRPWLASAKAKNYQVNTNLNKIVVVEPPDNLQRTQIRASFL